MSRRTLKNYLEAGLAARVRERISHAPARCNGHWLVVRLKEHPAAAPKAANALRRLIECVFE
eukprot:1499602-Alexandrium_andersonii.AAC.1